MNQKIRKTTEKSENKIRKKTRKIRKKLENVGEILRTHLRRTHLGWPKYNNNNNNNNNNNKSFIPIKLGILT